MIGSPKKTIILIIIIPCTLKGKPTNLNLISSTLSTLVMAWPIQGTKSQGTSNHQTYLFFNLSSVSPQILW